MSVAAQYYISRLLIKCFIYPHFPMLLWNPRNGLTGAGRDRGLMTSSSRPSWSNQHRSSVLSFLTGSHLYLWIKTVSLSNWSPPHLALHDPFPISIGMYTHLNKFFFVMYTTKGDIIKSWMWFQISNWGYILKTACSFLCINNNWWMKNKNFLYTSGSK